jgi:uncharacterized protein involved in exopolysaccharide biosynthesis
MTSQAIADRRDEVRSFDEGFVDPAPLSGVTIIALLAKNRRLIAIITLVVAAVFAGRILLSPRTFTVPISFMPDVRGPNPSVSGLAAQFGIPVNSGDPTQSPQFYLDLLTSDEILRSVALGSYQLPDRKNVGPQTLLQWYDLDASAKSISKVIRTLRGHLSASLSLRTGVIKAFVSADNAQVAVQVANHLIEELNKFNRERRLSRVGVERGFAEIQLREADAALRAAEDRMQSFLQTNREFRTSSSLSLQQDRLSRDVSMRQQLYTAAAQSFEQSKLDQIRDTPVLTILEPARVPAAADPRGLLRSTVFGILFGAILGILIVLIREETRKFRARYPNGVMALS